MPDVQSRTVAGEAEILQWANQANCRVEQSGYLFFLYNGNFMQHEMADIDGDGTPDTHTDYCCGNSIDPDTEEELCPYCKWAGCDGNCTEDLDDTDIDFDIDDFPGYDKEANRDCKVVADMLMKQILGENAYIGSSDNVIQLYEETMIDGDWALVGGSNSSEGFDVLNEHLNEGRPITVGVHDEFGYTGNHDDTTDHFVVIYGRGYDENKGQYYFNYIETGYGKGSAQNAYSDNLRFYYDPNEGTFKGYDCYGLETYDLVQIRPNNNRK